MFDELVYFRKKFNELINDRPNEENIKFHLVVPILQLLGYKSEWFVFEDRVVDKRSRIDISIKVPRDTPIYIEIKRGDKQLSEKDVEQIIIYLSKIGFEWGILTNGQEFILLNNSLKGTYLDKEVFKFDLLIPGTEKVLVYFTYEYLSKSKVTRYFLYLKQFDIYRRISEKKINSSLLNYHSSIRSFFDYLASKNQFIKLEDLRIQDVKDFIRSDIERKKSEQKRFAVSKSSIINKFRFIKGMYNTLIKHGVIQLNPLEYIREEIILEGMEYLESTNDFVPISDEEIEAILREIEVKNSFGDKADRNKLIVLLTLYAGLTREEIRSINISDINFNKRTLTVNQKVIPLPDNLIIRIKNLIRNREKNLKI